LQEDIPHLALVGDRLLEPGELLSTQGHRDGLAAHPA